MRINERESLGDNMVLVPGGYTHLPPPLTTANDRDLTSLPGGYRGENWITLALSQQWYWTLITFVGSVGGMMSESWLLGRHTMGRVLAPATTHHGTGPGSWDDTPSLYQEQGRRSATDVQREVI